MCVCVCVFWELIGGEGEGGLEKGLGTIHFSAMRLFPRCFRIPSLDVAIQAL